MDELQNASFLCYTTTDSYRTHARNSAQWIQLTALNITETCPLGGSSLKQDVSSSLYSPNLLCTTKHFHSNRKRKFSFTIWKRGDGKRGKSTAHCPRPINITSPTWPIYQYIVHLPLSAMKSHKHQSFRETFIIGLQNLCQYKVP